MSKVGSNIRVTHIKSFLSKVNSLFLTFQARIQLLVSNVICYFIMSGRSGSNSENWTWNNRLVLNQERSMSRLYVVTLLI